MGTSLKTPLKVPDLKKDHKAEMSHKHRTKDENFMIALYEMADQTGDVNATLDRYEVGNRVHLHPRAVNAICKLLIQANFIKKSGEVDIYLTKQGEDLVKRLLSE